MSVHSGHEQEYERRHAPIWQELADTLVRGEGISFREAHHLVSKAVRALEGKYSGDSMARATAATASWSARTS